MISKEKVWRYMNISDGVFIICFALGVIFFRDNSLNIAVGWLVVFICSGLGLRRYCKGKGMMRYGVISNVDKNDTEAIIKSYRAHRDTMVFSTLAALVFTLYQLYQSFT